MTGTESFEQSAERALADAQLRKNFAFAMGNFIMKRKAVFSDEAKTEQLRARGQAIKQRALSRLPELLEELEANCTRNGIRVHWAETPAVANRIVLDIVNAHSATGVVKGKSMVSEEMHLNAYLATHDVEFVATFAERVVLLGPGRVIADGPAAEVLSGGWYFATEVSRVLDLPGVVTPEQGAAALAGEGML